MPASYRCVLPYDCRGRRIAGQLVTQTMRVRYGAYASRGADLGPTARPHRPVW